MDNPNRRRRSDYRQDNQVVQDSSTTSTEGKQGSESNGDDPPEASRQNRLTDEQRARREVEQRERARRNAARLRRRRKERIAELIRRLKEYTDRKEQLDGEISQLRKEFDQIQQENAYVRQQLLLSSDNLGQGLQTASSTSLHQQRPEVDLLSSPLDFDASRSSRTADSGSSTPNVGSEQLADLLWQYIEVERLLQAARSLQTASRQQTAPQTRTTVGTGPSPTDTWAAGARPSGGVSVTFGPDARLLPPPPTTTVTTTDEVASHGSHIPSDSIQGVSRLPIQLGSFSSLVVAGNNPLAALGGPVPGPHLPALVPGQFEPTPALSGTASSNRGDLLSSVLLPLLLSQPPPSGLGSSLAVGSAAQGPVAAEEVASKPAESDPHGATADLVTAAVPPPAERSWSRPSVPLPIPGAAAVGFSSFALPAGFSAMPAVDPQILLQLLLPRPAGEGVFPSQPPPP